MYYKKPDIGKSKEDLADKKRYPICEPDTTDEFEESKLGLQWQWNANYEDSWYALEKGRLKLNAVAASPLRPVGDYRNLLLQKWPAPEFVCRTKMNFAELKEGDRAGYVSLGMIYASVAITLKDGKYVVEKIKGVQNFDCDTAYTDEEVLEVDIIRPEEFADADKPVYFKYSVKCVGHTVHRELDIPVENVPEEEITISMSLDGKDYKDIITIPSKAGRWVGVKSGVFCAHNSTVKSDAQGYVTVDYVRYDN